MCLLMCLCMFVLFVCFYHVFACVFVHVLVREGVFTRMRACLFICM